MENLYELLGIDPGAEFADIKCAFRCRSKIYHPDGESPDSNFFIRIREAYEVLSNPKLRKDYDFRLSQEQNQEKEKNIREKLTGLDTIRKVEIILAWSTTRPSFRVSFALSCFNMLSAGQELSYNQLRGIDNVIARFKINLDHWNDEDRIQEGLDIFLRNQEQDEED